ncbi:C4-dicarboxylate transporter DcuC [Vibrio crassostreae]|uniref:C4-dicarboxylate transporter DcuC n=1 Tax=Vibrio crassostreae TaxID=246167 RepID=UPI00200A0510|nr:C4-dicarboxylate transporter DcuC [Vibrio crassostreae]UPR28348.1 C4-dicarboxylate transporter DcuC [Vibrio crassostreae]
MLIVRDKLQQLSKGLRTLFAILSLALVLTAIHFNFGPQTFILAISFVVIAGIIKGIASNIYPQALILVGGTTLLLVTAFVFPETDLVSTSTGSKFIDVFANIGDVFSNSLARLGLTIMVIAGFSRYMYEIGASQKLVEISVKPLGVIKSRYALLGCCFVLIQFLAMFITSPAGLSLLLMSTLYPMLRSLGCTKASVAAVIASICINYGPAELGTILIAELSGRDLFDIFLTSQLPVLLIVIPFIGVMHVFIQRYWDNKDLANGVIDDEDSDDSDDKETNTPLYYALFPMLPLIIMFLFSDLTKDFLQFEVNVSIVSAMFISFFFAFFIDLFRTLDYNESAKKVSFLFEQMGQSFVTIVSILICAQVLAQGLIKIGFIETMFAMLPVGEGTTVLVILAFSLFIFASSMTLGSSTTFNAFAPLASEMAAAGGISTVKMLLSMYYSAGFGRAFSPIAGFIIAVSGLVGLKPYDLIKRNAIQLASGYFLIMILNYLMVS